MDPKQTILDLVRNGHTFAAQAEQETNVHAAEAHARRAIGYFNASNALLNAFAEFHSEMIELPEFVSARRFCRKFQF
jgi:hypothetical protein